MVRKFLASIIALSLFVVACDKDEDKDNEEEIIDKVVIDIDEYAKLHFPEAQLIDGVYVHVVEEGDGEVPVDGDFLYAYYVGKLLDKAPENATPFDTAHRRPDTYPGDNSLVLFQMDLDKKKTGKFIPGWYYGFAQLKRGSKAVFLIPDSLAYGASRRGIIPPNAALMFEVELINPK